MIKIDLKTKAEPKTHFLTDYSAFILDVTFYDGSKSDILFLITDNCRIIGVFDLMFHDYGTFESIENFIEKTFKNGKIKRIYKFMKDFSLIFSEN